MTAEERADLERRLRELTEQRTWLNGKIEGLKEAVRTAKTHGAEGLVSVLQSKLRTADENAVQVGEKIRKIRWQLDPDEAAANRAMVSALSGKDTP